MADDLGFFHQHDAKEAPTAPCPVCQVGEADLLATEELHRLVERLTDALGHFDADVVERVLNSLLQVRLEHKALTLALAGKLLPDQIDDHRRVTWRPIHERLPQDQQAAYLSQVLALAGTSQIQPSNGCISEAESDVLRLAASTGLGKKSRCDASANETIRWAERVRQTHYVLGEVIAGRLEPYFEEVDGESQLCGFREPLMDRHLDSPNQEGAPCHP